MTNFELLFFVHQMRVQTHGVTHIQCVRALKKGIDDDDDKGKGGGKSVLLYKCVFVFRAYIKLKYTDKSA